MPSKAVKANSGNGLVKTGLPRGGEVDHPGTTAPSKHRHGASSEFLPCLSKVHLEKIKTDLHPQHTHIIPQMAIALLAKSMEQLPPKVELLMCLSEMGRKGRRERRKKNRPKMGRVIKTSSH